MNLSLAWASYLVGRGHDAEHFAAHYALQGSSKPSGIQLRAKDMLPENLGPLVIRALSIANTQLTKGAIVTIKASRMRITKLPIGNTEPY